MRLANTNICLDDDTLFTGEECPQCLGRSYYPLRKWLLPLHSFRDIKEAHNAKRNLPIQEKREGSLQPVDHLDHPISLLSPKEFKQRIAELQTSKSITIDGDSEKESLKSSLDIGHYPNRVGVATFDSIKQRRSWFNASHALHSIVIRIFKRGFEMPSKKHYSGNDHPQTLPEDKPEFASGTDKV